MATTVLSDTTHTVDADVGPDGLVIDAATVESVLGWSLEEQGLCRGDRCVPLPGSAASSIDLITAAEAVGRTTLVDEDVVVLGVERDVRQRALNDLVAPDFTLPDLDGSPHQLSQWRGLKKLLVVFASW